MKLSSCVSSRWTRRKAMRLRTEMVSTSCRQIESGSGSSAASARAAACLEPRVEASPLSACPK